MAPRFYFGTISPYSWFAAERIGELIPDAHWRPVFAGGRWPDGWPGNDVLAARAMVVADQEGQLARLALAAMRACFREGRDITQPEVLTAVADSVGLEGGHLAQRAQTQAIKDALRNINDEAMASGVRGVPSVCVEGQVFWGDDRLAEAAAAAANEPARSLS
jgi:2-hydroxychromene-2-carboxylate isomerase